MPDIEKATAKYDLDEYYGKALGLIISGRARDAFDLSKEKKEMRERYGMNTFGQSCLLARRLIEAGTRFVEVNWPKVANSDNHSWDVHTGLTHRMKNQSAPMLDAGLSALSPTWISAACCHETLVVAVGEFGRSPQRGVSTSGNDNNDDGRDHWPYCYTGRHRRRRRQARPRLRQVGQDRLRRRWRTRSIRANCWPRSITASASIRRRSRTTI